MRNLFIFLFCCCVVNIHADEPHKLTVGGSAVVMKPADQLKMTVGVVTQDRNAQKAIQENREKMALVIEAVKNAGFSQKEYQTGTFHIAPQYAQSPKELPRDWRPEIVGYEVRNTLALETSKLELAGPAIDAVVKQGANLVEEVTFTLQDMQQAKNEAIAQAVRQARAYAETASKAASVSLGDILELSVNPSVIMPRAMKFAMVAEASTPITPGDVEVSANVSLVYAIK